MHCIGKKKGIAVVEMHGVIGKDVDDVRYARVLKRVRDSNSVGALLLDIDSPGGTASDSELLYQSVCKVSASKPVVAFIRGMGASGGYYVACGADRIVASRAAMVGSIGCIILRPIISQLMARMGVQFSVVKSGRLKDMSGFFREPTDEETDKWQALSDEVYELFIGVVSQGRGMDTADVRRLATGEIFTARAAVENKLLDECTDFAGAVKLVSTLGNTNQKVRHFRPKMPFMNKLGFPSPMGMAQSLDSVLSNLLNGGIYLMDATSLDGLWDWKRR